MTKFILDNKISNCQQVEIYQTFLSLPDFISQVWDKKLGVAQQKWPPPIQLLRTIEREPLEPTSSHSRSVVSLPCFVMSKPALMVHTYETGMTWGKAERSELENYYCLARLSYPVSTVEAIMHLLVVCSTSPLPGNGGKWDFCLFCYKMWPWWWGICLRPFSIDELKLYMDIYLMVFSSLCEKLFNFHYMCKQWLSSFYMQTIQSSVSTQGEGWGFAMKICPGVGEFHIQWCIWLGCG